MNTNDYTITSVYKDFAWDVTVIANGGDAFYFKPYGNLTVRYSRWIAGGVILLLLGGLLWTFWKWQQTGNKGRAWTKWLVILLNLDYWLTST
jgi:hypothetical protein